MLERLAQHTSFSAGRERALELKPTNDRRTAVRLHQETAEAIRLDTNHVTLSLSGLQDIRVRARNAALGHVLTPADLQNVAGIARSTQQVCGALSRFVNEAPLLTSLAEGIGDLEALRELIENSIDERGEVSDSASVELTTIRRELALAHERLQDRMQSLLNSPSVRSALQDTIITIRDGRYVLPVRTDSRGEVRGVIHDSSASGATIYVEPLAVVELGNLWRELQLQERREVERILRQLSAAVGDAADDLVDAVDRLAHIDLSQAKARLAGDLDARALLLESPEQHWLVEGPAELLLVNARHPLLDAEAVPITLEVGGVYRALLITGPNTGGKTVALKTAGLLCAMALAGMPIPVEVETRIPTYDAIFTDIGDEQSIEQSLSTFSSHMTSIIDVLERAGPNSLVLLDELGAGTDPTEGAALSMAIVDHLIEAGSTLIATTHHGQLKVYAHHNDSVINASVDFDLETLAPTYHLTIGLPGQSNALAIASSLGMPVAVIGNAREGLSTEERNMEELLEDISTQRSNAEKDALEAADGRREAEILRGDLQRQLNSLQAETARLREVARREVRDELRDVERLLDRARREVESARLEQAAVDLDRARSAAADASPKPVSHTGTEATGLPAIAQGDSVWLRGIGAPGEALSVPDDSGEFEMQLGALRTRVRVEQVEHSEPPDSTLTAFTPTIPSTPNEAIPSEIEVRGQTIDEAIPTVEKFLDQAARSGHERALVIHGRGTGTLRRAVHELLNRHPLVTTFEIAHPREGGQGVTVAHLAATN